jgi:hypothetical protein
MAFIKIYSTGARQNEKKTLALKVKFQDLINKVKDQVIKSALNKYTYHEDVNLWDFGVTASRHIKIGDDVYILCEGTLYHGNILEKISDENGEIGDIVEWHRIQHSPWKNPVFIGNLNVLHGLNEAIISYLKGKKPLEENFYKTL